MQYIEAKTILSSFKYQKRWFGTHYGMNLYKGCCHGCIYCDSRSECYGVEDFDRVRAKKNCLLLLERDLAKKRKTGIIGMGAMSDPYNPFEERLDLTGKSLDLIHKHRFGVAIATKSNLIVRDINRLRALREHSPTIVKITITTADNSLAQVIEPNASLPTERFLALKELSEAGLFTGVLIMPLLPYINDNWENIFSILCQAHEAGARFIYPGFGVTLRQNQREWYYNQLDLHFPGLKEKYIRQFEDQYSCYLPHVKELQKAFNRECEKRGILYKMKDIIEGSTTSHGGKQLTLF